MNADDFVNKNYKVQINFNVSGEVPPRFSPQDLKKGIEKYLSEIEQDSELYDDSEYYHWATFPEDFEFHIDEYEIDFVESMDCEHCGHMSEYFGARIYMKDSGIEWCQNCGESYLSSSEKKWVKKKGKKFKKQLIKNKINALKEELDGL
jgi:hypothetical protein